MNDKEDSERSRRRVPRPVVPVWWLMLKRELLELWIGGKALYLILIYTVLLGIVTYVMASNS